MKYIAVAALVVTCSFLAWAVQGNPQSNVLYDTSATANTLVMRDSNGATTLGTANVVTANIASEAVTTVKMYLDQPTSQILCVTTQKKIGTCSNAGQSTGACNCT